MKNPQLLIDLAVIVSVTVLGVFEVLPAEAVIAVLSALGGARVAQRNGDDDGPTGAAVALVAGAATMITARRVAIVALVLLFALPALAHAAPLGLDVSEVVSLAESHAWIPLAALIVGFLVRVSKTERVQALLGDYGLTPSQRPLVALGLGILAGVLDNVANGTKWYAALAGGVVSALIAMGGHDLLIEGLRGGREVGA